MNRIELRERLAKAYCAKENSFKVVDPVLIESMIDQLIGVEHAKGSGLQGKEEKKACKER